MKNILNKKTIGIIALVILIVGIGWFSTNSLPKTAEGSAPQGYQTNINTSSLISLYNATAYTLFATSTCTARIVTTTSTPILIKFGDNSGYTISNNIGHIQPATTTQAYDSGLYGCGLWTAVNIGSAYGGIASITVTEFSSFK